MKLTDLPDGLHHDVPAAVYHERIPALVSRSALEKFARAPAIYRAWLDGAQEESSPALAFGSAFHCAVLEPKVFASTYAVEPDFGDCRFKEAKAMRDAWRRDNAGKLLLSAADSLAIDGMAASVRAHPFAAKMLDGGASELTALWTDEATGLRCKARADYYVPARRLIVDLKSTEDARPEAFAKTVARFGYHKQRAFYGDGFAACGAPIEHFVFLCVEKTPPYLVALYVLDIESTARGRESVAATMTALAECLKTDSFPGYDASIQTITVPPWAA